VATQQGYQTKTEWIYAQVRGMIASGELASDTKLPLAQLAERFGTSEIPVREALRMLQQDGLVRIESHRGASVAGVSWEEVYDAIFVRTHLEILALSEAVPLHTEETLAPARSALTEMDRLVASTRRTAPDAFSEANRVFHRLLYEPVPSPVLKAQIEELWDRVWRTRSNSLFTMEREHMARVQEDHHGMIDAVEAGDVRGAASLATRHREKNLAAWRRIIDRASAAAEVPGSRTPTEEVAR
jgi:DNA-binding GntR family transcriptional regulator